MGDVHSVEQKKEEFRRDYPDGGMSLEDFKKEYAKLFPKGDTSDLAEYVFDALDINDDSEIDLDEFMCGVKLSCTGTIENKLKWAFTMCDLGDNGYILKPELLEIIQVSKVAVGWWTSLLIVLCSQKAARFAYILF